MSYSQDNTHYMREHFDTDCGGSRGHRNCSLDLTDSCSILSVGISITEDNQEVFVAGYDTYLLDPTTGTKYAARRIDQGVQLNKSVSVIGQKGYNVVFQIEFPRLPIGTKYIMIYGIPAVGLMGGRVFDVDMLKSIGYLHGSPFPEKEESPLVEFDNLAPLIPTPYLKKRSENYDSKDMTTWAVLAGVPKVFPVDPEHTSRNRFAMWFTKDTTYVTRLIECKFSRQPFYISPDTELKILLNPEADFSDENVTPMFENLKMYSSEPYPVNENFVIEGVPGDYVVILMKFPPLKLGCNFVSVDDHPEIFPEEWLLPDNMGPLDNSYVGEFRENRRYVRLMADEKGGHIVR